MIHLTKALIRRWFDTLLHVNDTPERTAAAFALGCLVGFSPFLGLHTLIALTLAFVFDLNRVATLLGPLLVPYMVGSLVGCTIIAALAYPLALAFVRRRRGLPMVMHHSPR